LIWILRILSQEINSYSLKKETYFLTTLYKAIKYQHKYWKSSKETMFHQNQTKIRFKLIFLAFVLHPIKKILLLLRKSMILIININIFRFRLWNFGIGRMSQQIWMISKWFNLYMIHVWNKTKKYSFNLWAIIQS